MDNLPSITLTTKPTRHAQSCVSLSLPLLALLDAILPPPPFLTLSIGSGPGLLEALFLKHYPSRAEVVDLDSDSEPDSELDPESNMGPDIDIDPDIDPDRDFDMDNHPDMEIDSGSHARTRTMHKNAQPSFLGIEVATPKGTPPVNVFLPERNMVTVPGTWAVCTEWVCSQQARALMFIYPRQGKLLKQYLQKVKGTGTGVEVVVWIGPRCDLHDMIGSLESESELELGGWERKEYDEVVEEGEMVVVLRRKPKEEREDGV